MFARHAARHPRAAAFAGLAALVIAVLALARAVDGATLGRAVSAAAGDPLGWLVVAGALLAAFAARAVAWHRVAPRLSTGHALSAILLSFTANHVLPFRLGELVRPASAARRSEVPMDALLASTVTLRAADVLSMGVLGVAVAPALVSGLLGALGWAALAGVAVVGAAGLVWIARLRRSGGELRLPGPSVAALSLGAWLVESFVVLQVAHWAGVQLGWRDALVVTVAAVSAQVLAVAPGGIGTYEAAATAALVALGVPGGDAVAVAVAAHGAKTLVSFAVGVPAAVWPSPSILGPMRLGRPAPIRPVGRVPEGPVVLVLPAHDEADRIAQVVRSLPTEVAGRATRCLVVDDGSVDATTDQAVAAGAQVVRHGANRGLGAAVRTGLHTAVADGAAVVAFCDADGEYDPAELDRLVAPILAGRADYVVGSRFAGDIRRMLPHRRVGNLILTRWVAHVVGVGVTDGQSGFRALSREAAAAARISHDYNYAQVLTVDLVGQGFRYAEVPITYAFRTSGRSFVKLGRYLRRVVPAVCRAVVLAAEPAPLADQARSASPRVRVAELTPGSTKK